MAKTMTETMIMLKFATKKHVKVLSKGGKGRRRNHRALKDLRWCMLACASSGAHQRHPIRSSSEQSKKKKTTTLGPHFFRVLLKSSRAPAAAPAVSPDASWEMWGCHALAQRSLDILWDHRHRYLMICDDMWWNDTVCVLVKSWHGLATPNFRLQIFVLCRGIGTGGRTDSFAPFWSSMRKDVSHIFWILPNTHWNILEWFVALFFKGATGMILMILAAQQDHSINSGQVVYPMWAECPMLTRMVIVGALSYADPKLGTKAKVYTAHKFCGWTMLNLPERMILVTFLISNLAYPLVN